MSRVLLTGHLGFIGSVMAPLLVEAGHDVVGLDTGYFRECTLIADRESVPALEADIRDVDELDLRGFDAVIHLAALSNDPVGNLNDGWTREINDGASVALARRAREQGVERFLFSSSCIMYGVSEAAVVNEDSPLDPQTEYARSKVRSEVAIRELADDGFSPTFLRNGTVYGLSPRMRFDTVLNNLVGSVVTSGRVVVHGDGSPWRPVVHVEDVSRAFRTVLEAPRDVIHDQAINVGADALNHTVAELADLAARAVPGGEVAILGDAAADRRTYKADFAKFARLFPDFHWNWNAERGAADLARSLRDIPLTAEMFDGDRFIRLRWLNRLLEDGRLDGSLRWREPAAVGTQA
jgi:nucleoside-diphosphate-sugar epimerase